MLTPALLCFPRKPYTLAGFEPWSSDVQAMTTAPPRQGTMSCLHVLSLVKQLQFESKSPFFGENNFQNHNIGPGKTGTDVNFFHIVNEKKVATFGT
jgi:hypothetical protein